MILAFLMVVISSTPTASHCNRGGMGAAQRRPVEEEYASMDEPAEDGRGWRGGVAHVDDVEEIIQEKSMNDMTSEEVFLWVSFFCVGAGTLAGWNSLCAAVDFFRLHFAHSPNAPVWFSWTFEIATMASLGVLALGADALSPQVRFALGFVSASIVLACIPVATKYMQESGAWTTVLFLTFTLGMGNGMTEGSLYGLAAAATSRNGSTRAVVQYAVPAQAGQGFAGVLVCLMRIVTKASFSEDYQGSSQAAQVFFSLASLLSLACSFVGYYIAKTIRASSRSTPLVLGWEQKKDVVHEIRLFARANVTINCVTMMVFPSLATSSKATTTPGLAVSWMAVLVVTIFSVADTVGNLQGMSVIGWLLRGRAPSVGFLIRAAEARILFVPLFLLTSVGLVQSDAVVVLGASLLGFTNGSLSVACMTLAPETVRSGACAGESASKKEYGGYIMTVALLVGVTLGLTVAIPLNLVADVLRSPALH